MAKKRIDVVAPIVKVLEGAAVMFSDIIKSADNVKMSNTYKDYQQKNIRTKLPNCLLGIVVTGQLKNLPPKKNKETGVFSELDLDTTTENLSFGNIHLYDSKMNVLFYEVNQNGCNLDDYARYLAAIWNRKHDDNKVEISFSTVSRKGDYERMVKMSQFKDVSIKIALPTEVFNAYKDDNSTVFSILKRQLKDAVKSKSDYLTIDFGTFAKRTNKVGLDRSHTINWVKAVRYILKGSQKKNVEMLKVKGYFTDPHIPGSIQTINLVADTFDIYITLPDKTKHKDLQENDRTSQIEKLYNNNLSELQLIFGK